MDPLNCWPPSPLQYPPSCVCFLLWINPYTCSPTNKDTDNTSTVGLGCVFFSEFKTMLFPVQLFSIWKASRRESLFNPRTHFQSCPTFVFTVLHDCTIAVVSHEHNMWMDLFVLVWGEMLSQMHATFIWMLVKAWLSMLTINATTFHSCFWNNSIRLH